MSELFDRQRLANTLDPLRDQYGIIIFDAGPSGSSKAEACFGLDAAIVVARRNTSDARALRAAVSVLKEHGTPTLGSILTD
jgi:MinD-like ATPase involved in chromosome partitioning or flagellar assembly